MKKIIIIAIIIVGIFGAWFIKNKETNQVEIDNNITFEQEEIKQEDNVEIIIEENKIEVEEPVVEDNKVEIEENSVGDGALDIPLVKIDTNDSNFELSTPSFDVETLTSYGLPILLDFGAEWCGPCKRMHPILEELNSELRGKAIVKYVDIDEYPDATKGFSFTLIPTQYFINKDGEIYRTHTGILSKEDAISILKEMGMAE